MESGTVVKNKKRLPGRQRTKPAKGRVLAMDDNADIRNLISTLLMNFGYAVSGARDGDEAVRKFQAAKEAEQPFDAVILNLVVPGEREGHEVLERVRSMDPGVKAILLTGEINHQAVANYEQRGFQSVLMKPFMGYELRQAIESAIAG